MARFISGGARAAGPKSWRACDCAYSCQKLPPAHENRHLHRSTLYPPVCAEDVLRDGLSFHGSEERHSFEQGVCTCDAILLKKQRLECSISETFYSLGVQLMKDHQEPCTLRIHNIYRRINGKPITPLLQLEVQPGEIAFLVGPSGCGKSSALRIIACLDPFESSIALDDDTPPLILGNQTPQSLTVPGWRRRVMYLSQTRIGVQGSPVDSFITAMNLAARAVDLCTSSVERDFLPACADVGLGEELANQEWQTLSGGQAQRAALAIRLAMRPNVLLLDEITSACDPDSTRLVEAAVRKHSDKFGTTILWVTHDPQQPARVMTPVQPTVIDFADLWHLGRDTIP